MPGTLHLVSGARHTKLGELDLTRIAYLPKQRREHPRSVARRKNAMGSSAQKENTRWSTGIGSLRLSVFLGSIQMSS